MRYRHKCETCGVSFSRRWNMERHLMRKHDAQQSYFSNSIASHEHAGFKAQKIDYHNWSSGLQKFIRGFNWPILDVKAFEQKDSSWLDRLRRMAEVSRLLKELVPTSASTFSYRLNGLIDNSGVCVPPFKPEDLEIRGYTAYICEECLVSHPLTLYMHGPSLKLVPAFHKCNADRIVEVQQEIHNKKYVIATLVGELPKLVLRIVRQWTKRRPSLRADEIPAVSESLHTFKPVDKKGWAMRAVRDELTFLSEGELVDFLNLAGHNTYACFKMKEQNKAYFMYIATEATKNNFPLAYMGLQ